MAEDDSMNDGELLGMRSAGGPRGVSVQDDLVQPQPMGVAMMHADSASNHFENEFSQGGDVRGCAVQGFRGADQASPRAESPGRAAAEPGTVEASEAVQQSVEAGQHRQSDSLHWRARTRKAR